MADLRTPGRDVVSPWARGDLRIVRSVLERVFEEAKAAYARDEESCGLLVGPSDDPLLVDGLIPMVNRANALHALDPDAYPRTARMYFDIDTLKFEAHLRHGLQSGRPVKVLYHSHLDAGAYFSDTDAAVARMGGSRPPHDLAYLVTSVEKGVVRDHRLFVWDDVTQSFPPSTLTVVG